MRERDDERIVHVPVHSIILEGSLGRPTGARGIVLFTHGSGSCRHSLPIPFVARVLRDAGVATLLIDLLTSEEEAVDVDTAEYRSNIGLLADRLVGITDWLAENAETAGLRVGYFACSTGAQAALIAAAERPERVAAVVSLGGRVDLPLAALPRVRAPTLLIVGGLDETVVRLNAVPNLETTVELVIIPGATHLFEEAEALEEVSHQAVRWFRRHIAEAGEFATV
jgi:pimeloyl-ACP methyl ester carboxylesterase